MSEKRQNVLVIGLSAVEYAPIAALLQRSHLEVDRFPTPARAIELINEVSFRVILARHPLAEFPTAALLKAIRTAGGPCHGSATLLVTGRGYESEAQRYLGAGANRVIPLHQVETLLLREVASLLKVSPRKEARALIHLDAKIHGYPEVEVTQTANISLTGALIVSTRLPPLGAKIQLEFRFPNQRDPIMCDATVARHTLSGRDPFSGIGVRFTRFYGDGKPRLKSFLDAIPRVEKL